MRRAAACIAPVLLLVNAAQYLLPFWVNVHPFDPEGNLSYALHSLHLLLPSELHLALRIFALGVFSPALCCLEVAILPRAWSLRTRLLLAGQSSCMLFGAACFATGAGMLRMEEWMEYGSVFTPAGYSILLTLTAAGIGMLLLCVRGGRG